MDDNTRKSIIGLADTLQGEINRMCVTEDLSEFDTMYGHAKKNLDKLSKMIYAGRFKAEKRKNKNDKEKRVTAYSAILEAIPVWYHNRKFKMQCGMYVITDNIFIRLVEEGEGPYCSMSVNISELPAEQFALDTNNFPEAEVFCIANRIAHPTGQFLISGYCRYPVYELESEIVKCCNRLFELKEDNTNGSKEDN